ncbi:MAG: HIT domain-containing protein [Deltaproteobacteria bacterium]|nr:HIT domain-containing protein [Deltaproteobacteria bacterium]
MGEMRLDPTTRAWILVESHGHNDVCEHNHDGCPFCPGNEHLTPDAIHTIDNGKGWIARAFPDKKPVFRIELDEAKQGEGLYDRMMNRGAHEVIVENPSHGTTLANISEDDISYIFDMYAKRILDLKQDKMIRHINIFKNQGRATGAAIEHLHSHLVASPVIPTRIEQEMRWAKHHYDMKERCLFCDIIRQEIRDGRRIVMENKDFIAFCPFASIFPYEVWIAPKLHNSSFEKDIVTKDRQMSLAQIMKGVIKCIEGITPHYHIVMHNVPNEETERFDRSIFKTLRQDFHWHFEIHPLAHEVIRPHRGNEFHINPVTAERAAEGLKRQV